MPAPKTFDEAEAVHFFQKLALMNKVRCGRLSLNPADEQQLSWWINDVQKLWITNPAIADNPVLEGTKIGKLLVRHASAMPQDRDFLLDDYLPTQWIAGKFLAELNRVSGDEMLHIYRPYIAAVLAVFDAFGKREEALRRGTLRVEFEKN